MQGLGLLAYAKNARSLSRRTSVKHNSEAAHEIEASAASGKRPSEAAARQQKRTVGLNTGAMGVGKKVRVSEKPTLADAKIDKNLANRARKLNAFFSGLGPAL